MITIEVSEQELNFLANASYNVQISARDAELVTGLQKKLVSKIPIPESVPISTAQEVN